MPLRGDGDSRVAKLDAGEVDAAVLAASGLGRIGLSHRISEVFEPDMMCPSVGQGAIGVECKADDDELIKLLEAINHEDTFACISAERELLKELGGSCHTPIGGYCVVTANKNLRLIAMVASLDGQTIIRGREKLPYEQAEELGRVVAKQLLDQSAGQLISACEAAA